MAQQDGMTGWHDRMAQQDGRDGTTGCHGMVRDGTGWHDRMARLADGTGFVRACNSAPSTIHSDRVAHNYP